MDNQYVRQSLNSRRVCLLVSLSLSSERDRQTEKQFESSIWQTESRVSTMITDDTRFGLKFLVLFIHVHASSWAHQTECQVSTSIKCHWWTLKYSCMTLTHAWHSCMTHDDQSFVFECQVFQMSQVYPVFQSRSLCQDFYIHRLAPLVSHSKNKKADFLQVCTQFSIVLLDV